MRQRMMVKLLAVAAGIILGGAARAGDPAGCTSCGSTDTLAGKHGLFGKVPGPLLGPIGKGTAMPVGCSCYAAEKTFFWGGCKQFFNPANECGPKGCGLFGKQNCPAPIYGPGMGQPGNNCNGTFTYLNR